jgi:hypothetical protein
MERGRLFFAGEGVQSFLPSLHRRRRRRGGAANGENQRGGCDSPSPVQRLISQSTLLAARFVDFVITARR